MRGRRRSSLGGLCLVAASLAAAVPAAGARSTEAKCRLDEESARWIQRALSSWERGSVEFLRLPPAPLPWIALFDTTCTWHLAPDASRLSGAQPDFVDLRFQGRAVLLWAQPHHGTVELPNGTSMPVTPTVYAAFSRALERPYFVLALPEVFRRDPAAARDPRLSERILGVVSHEILHTRQLPDLQRAIDALGQRTELPDRIDDNVVETRFGRDSTFRAAFEAERDLLYEAAFEPDTSRARGVAARAVTRIRERRARHFVGADEVYGRLEELFLNLEGAAEWLRFQLHRADPGDLGSDAEIVAFIRGRNNEWVQDEGLALFLVLDRFAGDWQSRLLGPDLASPIDALEEALRPDAGA
jgi:hypothetical protein